jgi:hypothetical protein
MLDIGLTTLQALQEGSDIQYKVKLYMQQPEEYTKDDYLHSIGTIHTEMSNEGTYQIANTEVVLKNIKEGNSFHFSERFENEFPVDKLVEVFAVISGSSVLVLRGIVDDWELTEEDVRLRINA